MNTQLDINLNSPYRLQPPTYLSANEVIEQIDKTLIIQGLSSRINLLTQQCNKLKDEKSQWNGEKLTNTKLNQNNAKIIQQQKQKNEDLVKRCQQFQKQLQNLNNQIEVNKSINGGFDDLKRIMEKRFQMKQELQQSKQYVAQCEEIRKRDMKLSEFQLLITNYQQNINNLNQQIEKYNLKMRKAQKLNQEQKVQIYKLQRQIANLKEQTDAAKQKVSIQYQQSIRDIEQISNRQNASHRFKQTEFNTAMKDQEKQIQVLLKKCSQLNKKLTERLVSEGEISKQKSKLEYENQNLNNQIQFLTKKTLKYKAIIQDIKLEDKTKYQLQLERIQIQNQTSLNKLNEQLRKQVDDFILSSKNKQNILLQQMQWMQQQYKKQAELLKGNILTLKNQLNYIQIQKEEAINNIISNNNQDLTILKSQINDMELQLAFSAQLIKQIKGILNINSKKSKQDKQLPTFLQNLLTQNSENIERIKKELNNIQKQKNQLCQEMKKIRQLIRTLTEQFKTSNAQNIISINDSKFLSSETNSQIQKFIKVLIQVTVQTQQQRKDQQSVIKNISENFQVTQRNYTSLSLIKEKLQNQSLKQEKEIQTLKQELITLSRQSQSALNSLKLQIQSLTGNNVLQKQKNMQNQGMLKQQQILMLQKDEEIVHLKQMLNHRQNQQVKKQQLYIQDLQREKMKIQQNEQRIEEDNQIIHQITNKCKSLESELTVKIEESGVLNQQIQKIRRLMNQLQIKSQIDLQSAINNQQRNHIQTCSKQIRNICQALNEVSDCRPQCNSFEDVIKYIKNDFLSSADTTLTVSPILENRTLERSFLKEQVCKFLQIRKISTTFIYKYDKFNSILVNYLPQITNNFPYIVLMKTEKQIFGVISEGMDKKSLPFNLNRKIVYPPIKSAKSQNSVSNRVLNFGNEQIKLSSSRQKLQVSIFTINGDRCYNFSKSDLVGSEEQKERIPLQAMEIHKINL